MQVLRSDLRGDQSPVLAAVGPMQFEVVEDRMTNEFNVPDPVLPARLPGRPAHRRRRRRGAGRDAGRRGPRSAATAPTWRCSSTSGAPRSPRATTPTSCSRHCPPAAAELPGPLEVPVRLRLGLAARGTTDGGPRRRRPTASGTTIAACAPTSGVVRHLGRSPLPRGLAESLTEASAEVAGVGEPAAVGDRGDAGSRGGGDLPASELEPTVQQPLRGGRVVSRRRPRPCRAVARRRGGRPRLERRSGSDHPGAPRGRAPTEWPGPPPSPPEPPWTPPRT